MSILFLYSTKQKSFPEVLALHLEPRKYIDDLDFLFLRDMSASKLAHHSSESSLPKSNAWEIDAQGL